MEKAWESFVNSLSRACEGFAHPYETRVTVPLDFEVVNIDRQLPERQPRAHFLPFQIFKILREI